MPLGPDGGCEHLREVLTEARDLDDAIAFLDTGHREDLRGLAVCVARALLRAAFGRIDRALDMCAELG